MSAVFSVAPDSPQSRPATVQSWDGSVSPPRPDSRRGAGGATLSRPLREAGRVWIGASLRGDSELRVGRGALGSGESRRAPARSADPAELASRRARNLCQLGRWAR